MRSEGFFEFIRTITGWIPSKGKRLYSQRQLRFFEFTQHFFTS